MSRISDAFVDTLLDEVTDYASVKLTPAELSELKEICDRWEDRDSIETEINIYIQRIGYKWSSDTFQWEK